MNKAVISFRKTIVLDPDLLDAYHWLGRSLVQLNENRQQRNAEELRQAEENLQHFLNKKPNDEGSKYWLETARKLIR